MRLLPHTLASALHTRLQLAITELEEEWESGKRTLLLAVLFVYFLTVGLLLLTFFVLAILPEAYRVYGLGGFALLYLVLALFAALVLRQKGRARPRLFSTTLSELRKDIDLLKPKV
ncbi:MAG: phage holin family protein [Deltaproteobacteria bacterium]|nr:phage holin family protein [Deltaproteobacteria bacterium]